MTALRLIPELVPAQQFGANLRAVLPTREWDRLRRACYAAAGNRCEVCGGAGRRHAVECHERWAFDDASRMQTLVGLVALCPACHEATHLGRAIAIGNGPRALVHLARVNAIDEGVLQVLVERVFALWEHRCSLGAWTLDLSWLQRKEA